MEKQDTLPLQHHSLESQDVAKEKRDDPKDTSLEDSTMPEGNQEYVTGFKLTIVIAACTTAGFIMLLDTSIVATVSETSTIPRLSR
jgi:hypothetical protein